MKRILIACIGNIFWGDDGFGFEVAQALLKRALPAEVQVSDFGIRSYDLAYALADGYETVILVDATPQGKAAGTVMLIEPDLGQIARLEQGSVDAHNLNPVAVLQMAQSMGARPGQLYLLGCEPGELGGENGRLGLTQPVAAAVPQAVAMIEALVQKLLQSDTTIGAGAVPA